MSEPMALKMAPKEVRIDRILTNIEIAEAYLDGPLWRLAGKMIEALNERLRMAVGEGI